MATMQNQNNEMRNQLVVNDLTQTGEMFKKTPGYFFDSS